MRFRPRNSLALLCVSSILAAPLARAQPAPAPAAADADEGDDAEEAPAAPKKPAAPPAAGTPAPAAPKAKAKDADADEAAADEEAADEEAEGPSPSRPPAKGKGVIWGFVREKADHEPTIEATVTVVGTKYKALTDVDGRYRLELPPGNYRLRFFFELHVPLRFEDVKVAEGKVAQLDADLAMQEDAIDTVEIETEVTRSTIEGEILTRQRAAAAGDSVGRVEIAKTPDRNAAQAAQRVVGATIVGGRFVYVRGLGERYTNAQLNGAPLPSPEPDRAAIPLDLFPTLVLDSITIAKTFTPDAPGDFAGGSVRIETREIPSKFLFQVSGTGGLNSQSSFYNRLTSNSGKTDWLGFDDGTRALPYDFPKTKLDRNADPDLTDRSGRAINSFFHTKHGFTPPDHGVSVVAGNGWTLNQGQKLGVLGAINYGRAYSRRRDEVSNEFTIGPNGTLIPSRSYSVQRGSDSVNWGGFGSISYRFNDDNKLTLLGLHTQIADNTVQIADGTTATTAGAVHDSRINFVARNLDFGQLQGQHRFKALGSATLDWTGWLSNANRNEPDARAVVLRKAAGAQVWGLQDDENSGRHFWADQSELGVGGKADWTQPLSIADSNMKVGALISEKSRDFTSRSMAFRPSPELSARDRGAALSCANNTDFDACADNLFVNPNIGPVVRLFETTRPEDAYKARLGVYAGYVMADLTLAKPLRVVVGERIEVTRQTIDPFDQFNPDTKQQGGKVNSTDLLPSASLIIETSKRTKLRASISRTLARPQLRELAPFAYQDYFGGRFTSGNPNLKLTHITNVDVRYEFFPTVREVLAASVFHKDLVDPIETVTQPTGDRGLITFENAPGAKLYGIELEARKSLAFLSEELKDFSTITNVTFAKSTIELTDANRGSLTSTNRPLVNQAPYVLNIALDYSNEHGTIVRALYNLVGPRIVQIGSEGLPDAYIQARHLLDLTLAQDFGSHFQVKLAARNLLLAQTLVTQGRKEQGGNIVSRYAEPALFSLTGTYTY